MEAIENEYTCFMCLDIMVIIIIIIIAAITIIVIIIIITHFKLGMH